MQNNWEENSFEYHRCLMRISGQPGDHFARNINVESLCCTLKTNKIVRPL